MRVAALSRRTVVALALFAAAAGLHRAAIAEAPPAESKAAPAAAQRAPPDFGRQSASPAVRRIAGWVVQSDDSRGMPFAIVDKVESRVFVFDANGRLRGAAAALLGLAQGDDSVPGIGSRPMSTITLAERTTPAGRFNVSMGRTTHGDELLWIDYDAAIALHRVVVNVPKERRLQRLASQVAQERRITYGCINVPVKFFDTVVAPAFRGTTGVVYVLPEIRSIEEVFGLDGGAGVTRPAAVPPSLRPAPAASAPGPASNRSSRTTGS